MTSSPHSLRAKASKWTPDHLIILDIDSTLLLTHKRNEAILHRYAKDHKDSQPAWARLIAAIECRPCEYGYGRALERVGAHKQSDEEKQHLAQYWRERFFSNEFLNCDLLHKGALEFVHYLQNKKIPFVYLTGRYEGPMQTGTLTSLQALGLPVQVETLFMKERRDEPDELYKADRIEKLKKRAQKLVLIDNEPKILNKMVTAHPDVDLIFVDTCHSPNVTPPAGVFTVKDFSEFL